MSVKSFMRKCTVTAAAVSCFVFLCTAQQNGGGRMVMSIGDIFAIADSASSIRVFQTGVSAAAHYPGQYEGAGFYPEDILRGVPAGEGRGYPAGHRGCGVPAASGPGPGGPGECLGRQGCCCSECCHHAEQSECERCGHRGGPGADGELREGTGPLLGTAGAGGGDPSAVR